MPGKGFGALPQVIGRAGQSLRKYVVRAPKRVGVDLMDFAAAETAEAASGRNNSKSGAKSMRRQTLTK